MAASVAQLALVLGLLAVAKVPAALTDAALTDAALTDAGLAVRV